MLKNVDVARLETQLQALGEHRVAADARELIEWLQPEVKFKQTKIDAMNFELARLKQWRFGKSSESLDAQGGNPQSQLFDAKTEALLLEESQSEDRAENEARATSPTRAKRQAKRQALPSQLERIDHHYEIEPAVCSAGHALKRIGQEISEQLDCVPAQFFVHRHIRGKYAWVIRSSDLETTARGVVCEFCNSRQGQHAATLLEGFQGSLVCDDYAGYKALFKQQPIQEAGCWAHARRKFFEAHKLNQSEIAKEALHRIQRLYDVERQGLLLDQQERYRLRQDTSAPQLQEFKVWLLTRRQQLMNADVTAKAMDYLLRRWSAMAVYLSDARIPIDNNAVENAIRPLALGRKNWLFVGSQQAGERAAVLMTLIESAKLNGHDAWAYLKDVLTKLATWPNSRLQELLPHHWVPPEAAATPVNT